MVSGLDYFSFKKFEIRKQKPFNMLVSIILMMIVVAYRPRIVLFFLIGGYVLSGPIITIARTRARKAPSKAQVAVIDVPFISTKDDTEEGADSQPVH